MRSHKTICKITSAISIGCNFTTQSEGIWYGLVVVFRADRLAAQGRIRLVAHQACPQYLVELGHRNLVGFGEVEAGRDRGPVGSIMLRLDIRPGRKLHIM